MFNFDLPSPILSFSIYFFVIYVLLFRKWKGSGSLNLVSHFTWNALSHLNKLCSGKMGHIRSRDKCTWRLHIENDSSSYEMKFCHGYYKVNKQKHDIHLVFLDPDLSKIVHVLLCTRTKVIFCFGGLFCVDRFSVEAEGANRFRQKG